VIGDLSINTSTKNVTLKGQPVLLTKKEFEILSIMAKSPNRIFSREDILGRVWEDDGYVLERTVDVHITRLRKKLGEFGKHIANRSGYGYCLEA
ncbi:MAG: winged helix family transcriptional regulator, partial [Odoribacter splanchnicus]|nr:winged helix family transcriptional regulator [Odoribacter splanchnicus]